MASLNDRDAGRDFEGNGPSSFDRREYRVSPADVQKPSAETVRICREAEAQIERMMAAQLAAFVRRAAA